jgi:hypothetical protein
VARKRALGSGVDPSVPFPGRDQTRVKEGVDSTFGFAPCPKMSPRSREIAWCYKLQIRNDAASSELRHRTVAHIPETNKSFVSSTTTTHPTIHHTLLMIATLLTATLAPNYVYLLYFHQKMGITFDSRRG